MNGAACMQVGGLAHGEALAFSQAIVQRIARRRNRALGLVIERNPAFSAGRGGAAAALLFDQAPNCMAVHRRSPWQDYG